MTSITLEIPDELAARLAPLRDRLPELLRIAVELSSPCPKAPRAGDNPVFDEMIDFLAGGPSPEQIAAFKVSPSAQARLEELLEKNRENELTDEEAAELDLYEQINHVMLLLKARARLALTRTL